LHCAAARLIAGFSKVQVQNEGGATEAPPALLEPLSNREFDILTLIARDLSNKSIGARPEYRSRNRQVASREPFRKIERDTRQHVLNRARALSLIRQSSVVLPIESSV
jgi:DNA-binding NarL/FixJ family response regulator